MTKLPTEKEIGRRLKKLRELKGWQRQEVARMLEVKLSTYGCWESGVRSVTDKNKVKISNLYEKTIDEIFFS
jgi:transcriptional regulator with XRE-family HTH domain